MKPIYLNNVYTISRTIDIPMIRAAAIGEEVDNCDNGVNWLVMVVILTLSDHILDSIVTPLCDLESDTKLELEM